MLEKSDKALTEIFELPKRDSMAFSESSAGLKTVRVLHSLLPSQLEYVIDWSRDPTLRT